MLPNAKLLLITATTGSRSLTAVSRSCATIQKLPSPHTVTTGLAGRASRIPIAAGSPQPIEPPAAA